MELTEEVGAVRQSSEGRLSVVDVVLGRASGHRRRRRAAIAAAMLVLVVLASLRLGANHPPRAAAARTSALTEIQVASCPVAAGDYAGTPFSPRAAPATLRLPASLAPPPNARIFGTWFLPGQVSYLLGPASATCQAGLGSADGGEGMMVTPVSDRAETVTMTIRAGGAGPSTDLACPYIPAVFRADEAFRLGYTSCTHPSADVIQQIPTGTAHLYAAAVFVPAGVKDPDIEGPGDGVGPGVALYTAWAGSGGAFGQVIACTLSPAQGDICAASLKFFLATQSSIRTQMSAANLAKMEEGLSSFLAGQDIR
jgi:hypothetical protein